jgi:transposase
VEEDEMEIMYKRVAGLDVHKATVVACVRVGTGRKVTRECRTFDTTTDGLLALLAWLVECRCSHVAMEATGVYWMPVWKILGDGACHRARIRATRWLAMTALQLNFRGCLKIESEIF